MREVNNLVDYLKIRAEGLKKGDLISLEGIPAVYFTTTNYNNKTAIITIEKNSNGEIFRFLYTINDKGLYYKACCYGNPIEDKKLFEEANK